MTQYKSHLKVIDSQILDLLLENYRAQLFAIYSIGTVTSTIDFFLQVKNAFPLDPPISGQIRWQSLSDSLWNGLRDCGKSRIVLAMRDATGFQKDFTQDFEHAIYLMNSVSSDVELQNRIEGIPNSQIIVVVGLTGV